MSEERDVSSCLDTGMCGALCDINCEYEKEPDLTLKDLVTIGQPRLEAGAL